MISWDLRFLLTINWWIFDIYPRSIEKICNSFPDVHWQNSWFPSFDKLTKFAIFSDIIDKIRDFLCDWWKKFAFFFMNDWRNPRFFSQERLTKFAIFSVSEWQNSQFFSVSDWGNFRFFSHVRLTKFAIFSCDMLTVASDRRKVRDFLIFATDGRKFLFFFTSEIRDFFSTSSWQNSLFIRISDWRNSRCFLRMIHEIRDFLCDR